MNFRFTSLKLFVLLGALLIYRSAPAVKYTELCGHIYTAFKQCNHEVGSCVGKVVVRNVCQYTFFKVPIPAGTKYFKISIRNKVLYHRLSCRQVKVLVRMDNDFLNQGDIRVANTVFLDQLLNGDTFLLLDDAKVFVSSRRQTIATSHYIYFGTLTHADEITVTLEVPEGALGRLKCWGVESSALDIGCSGDKECGQGNPYSEGSPYSHMRDFFRRFLSMQCMPGNLAKCRDAYDCEDAGGYWLDNTCVEYFPLKGKSYYQCGYECYFSISTDKDIYKPGDKIHVMLNIPKFESKVDVYVGVLFPDGSLKIASKEDEQDTLIDVSNLTEIKPYASAVKSPESFTLTLHTAVHTFNGDLLELMPPGTYEFYLLVTPKDRGLFSEDSLLTAAKVEIRQ